MKAEARPIEQPPVQPGGIQLAEHVELQERMWLVERIAWVVLALVLLAALLGAFGPGPLSHTTVTSPDGAVSVNYERFVRTGGTTTVEVQISGPAAQQQELRVAVGGSLLDSTQVEQVTPEPSEGQPEGEGAVYVFPLSGGTDQVMVVFDLRLEDMGPVDGTIGVVDGPSVPFSLFVYP